jgi:hypothetical protein
MDPVEWFSWLYGKGFFYNHPYWGAAVVGGVFALIAFLIAASLWVMGAERYRERHLPAVVLSTNPLPTVKTLDPVPQIIEKAEPIIPNPKSQSQF